MKYKVNEVLSNGYIYGKCLPLHFKVDYSDFVSIEAEMVKFDTAIDKTIKQLNILKDSNPDLSEYIMMELLIVSDPSLSQNVHKMITNSVRARDAIETILNKHIENINTSTSEYLRERTQDIEDIKGRIIYNLENYDVNENSDNKYILALDELFPSILIQRRNNIIGVVVKKGGYTSHAAIMCRSFDIPLVVSDIDIKEPVELIIDTRREIIITEPTSDDIERYNKHDFDSVDKKAISHDGYLFLANVSSNLDLEKVREYNFDAIGLYRTEMIFMNSDRPYTLDEQYAIYKEALDIMKDKFIVFRTFDVSHDKRIQYLKSDSRGIQNYIDNPNIFENQIKAILKANNYDNVRIMFPMIETNAEFEYLRDWVLRIQKSGNYKMPKIGMMLETKSALSNINDFVKADFISIGTNDLTKDLFGIDRDNSFDEVRKHLNELIDCLVPVVEFCDKYDKCLSVCGELASITDIAVRFYKIGIKNLSVSPSMMKMLNKSYSKYIEK
ncbi:MAG: phosphoenolpyruvate--protein phosphotransferase [Acholeplasmatales bacterium]|nr:phosphoenolpyruvate--protein phosphotransferase [Acholeplasmatales bacterium]